MAVRPIVVPGPGQPQRKWSSQLQLGPSSGVSPPAEYTWGTHAHSIHSAEGLKSTVFRSVAAAVVVTASIPALIFVPQQVDASVNQSFIESPLRGATPRTIPQLSTVPQVDLTQQGWIARPTAANQGRVPPATFGSPQVDPSQTVTKLTLSQPAAPAVATPVAQFFSIPTQTVEQPTRAVWPSQLSLVVSYALQAITTAPQTDTWQLPAQVFPSVVTPPVITGAVPPLILAGQPQTSSDQIPALTWAPLVLDATPPAPIIEIIRGGDDAPRKKKKRRKSSIEELNDLLDRVVEENTPSAPASAKALKQITDAISDQDDDDEEAFIALY